MIYSPTIQCAEEHGSVTENLDLDKAEAKVTLRCAYNDRWDLVGDLLGYLRPWPGCVGWANPPRARKASIKSAGDCGHAVGQGIVYEEALVDVDYSTESDTGDGGEESGQDIVAESLEPTVEFLTLDHKRFRWSSGDPLLEGEAPGMQVRSLAIKRTHYRVVPPLNAGLVSLVGYCNSAQYTSSLLGLTFAAQTLLFQPPSLSRKITTDGERAFDISMSFVYKPDGWNKFWRTKTQQYESIYDEDGNIVYNYPPGNFASFLY